MGQAYQEIAGKVRNFVKEAAAGRGASLTDSSRLFELEVFDSLKIVTMVVFMEKEFGIQLDSEDLSEENLGSIDSIVSLILRKMKT